MSDTPTHRDDHFPTVEELEQPKPTEASTKPEEKPVDTNTNWKATSPDYHEIHVAAFTDKRGKVYPAHVRYMRKKRGPQMAYDPIGHRRVPRTKLNKKQKQRVDDGAARIKQPKPIKSTSVMPYPRSAHALHLYQQLAAPLAFFIGMKVNNQLQDRLVNECVAAIKDARQFIDRFTGDGNG